MLKPTIEIGVVKFSRLPERRQNKAVER